MFTCRVIVVVMWHLIRDFIPMINWFCISHSIKKQSLISNGTTCEVVLCAVAVSFILLFILYFISPPPNWQWINIEELFKCCKQCNIWNLAKFSTKNLLSYWFLSSSFILEFLRKTNKSKNVSNAYHAITTPFTRTESPKWTAKFTFKIPYVNCTRRIIYKSKQTKNKKVPQNSHMCMCVYFLL